MHYPFVREDSYWKDPAKPQSIQVDESVTTPRESSGLDLKQLLESSVHGYYHLCFHSDKNQEGCFQMGNLRVRKASLSKKRQLTEEAVHTNDLKQDAPVEQGSS
jgi:hypothetical protein